MWDSAITCVRSSSKPDSLDPLSDENQLVELPIPERFKTQSHDLQQSTVRKSVDAIANDEEMSPSFEDGLRNQRVIDAVVASAQAGRWLDVA